MVRTVHEGTADMRNPTASAEMKRWSDALEATGAPVYQSISNDYTLCERFWTALKCAFEIGKLYKELSREDWSDEID